MISTKIGKNLSIMNEVALLQNEYQIIPADRICGIEEKKW